LKIEGSVFVYVLFWDNVFARFFQGKTTKAELVNFERLSENLWKINFFMIFSLRNGLWKVWEETRKDCNPQSVESRAKQWFQRKFRSQSQRKQAFELQKEPVQSIHHHRQVWKVSDLPYQSSPSGLTFLPRLCLQKRHLCYVRHQNPQNQKLQTKFSVKNKNNSITRTAKLIVLAG